MLLRHIYMILKVYPCDICDKTKKLDALSLGNCKSCIKSIHGANVLTFGTNKDTVVSFVTENAHEFSFVF